MSYASEIEMDAIKTFDSTRIYLTTRNTFSVKPSHYYCFSVKQKPRILHSLTDGMKNALKIFTKPTVLSVSGWL